MPAFLFAVLTSRIAKITLLTALLLFLFSALKAQELVYLKNHWTREYIGFWNNENVNLGPGIYPSSQAKKTIWYIERVDDTWVRIKTKDGLSLNVEKGKLEVSDVPPGFFSAQWKLAIVGGYNTIVNRWTGVYIHNQNGPIEASAGNNGWWSAQWSMEDEKGRPLLAKDYSMRAYTTFVPNQQQYYKFENLHYDPKVLCLDINKTRSSELTTMADYGGDNTGKAWKFTQVSEGWYKISNLKLGGNKVLAIAKNTNGTYYFVLTDFANYPNQLWRMIQFKDQTLLNFVTDNKLGAEKFSSFYYTLMSKQHGLEAITAMASTEDNPRIYNYGFGVEVYNWSPFDITWKLHPIDDATALKNVPLSAAEQEELVRNSINDALRATDEALLKATPIATSPFAEPVGHVSGQDPTIFGGPGGRDLSVVIGNVGREYTQQEWDYAMARAGKIPMAIYNNSNLAISFTINYTNESNEKISRVYAPTGAGKNILLLLDPYCTNISFTGTDGVSAYEVYRSSKFYRSAPVKIILDGNINGIQQRIANWQ